MRTAETGAKAWELTCAGLGAALVVAVWRRPPTLGTIVFAKAAAEAILWIATTTVAGVLGMAAAQTVAKRRRAWPELRHLLRGAAAFALIPPTLLCWVHGLRGALLLAALVGAAMAVCLRGLKPPARREPADRDPGPFALLPPPDSGWGQAFAIAVSAEFALILAGRGAIFLAALLAGTGAFLFVWKLYASLLASPRETVDQSAARAGLAAMLALAIVIPLLLIRFVPPNAVEGTAEAAGRTRSAPAPDTEDSYRGILLFTVREKQKQLPPVPLDRSALLASLRKPMLIPFDGAYWYFQAPRGGVGAHPHIAQGDPVSQSIYSTGWIPLAMQAHQTLPQPLDLRSCAAIVVKVRNGDNRPGRVDLGLVLADSGLPDKASLYLGTEPLTSTESNQFTFKAKPVEEELRFAIPSHPGLNKFDQITVFYFPDAQRSTLGARIAVEQFELLPR